jgi:hypothetical protein
MAASYSVKMNRTSVLSFNFITATTGLLTYFNLLKVVIYLLVWGCFYSQNTVFVARGVSMRELLISLYTSLLVQSVIGVVTGYRLNGGVVGVQLLVGSRTLIT